MRARPSALWVTELPNARMALPISSPGPCPGPGSAHPPSSPGLLQPWLRHWASVRRNLVSSSLYEVTEVETSQATPSPSQPLIPFPHPCAAARGVGPPAHPSTPVREAVGQPHLLFHGSLRRRGPGRLLEKLHLSFNGGPLHPRLAEVEVRVEEVLVFLLPSFL